MTSTATLLPKLKIDLGITTTAFDTRLTDHIDAAKIDIEREGIVLGSAADDDDLILMFAGWRWRNRATGEKMPRMLRFAMNNKLCAQKMGGA